MLDFLASGQMNRQAARCLDCRPDLSSDFFLIAATIGLCSVQTVKSLPSRKQRKCKSPECIPSNSRSMVEQFLSALFSCQKKGQWLAMLFNSLFQNCNIRCICRQNGSCSRDRMMEQSGVSEQAFGLLKSLIQFGCPVQFFWTRFCLQRFVQWLHYFGCFGNEDMIKFPCLRTFPMR